MKIFSKFHDYYDSISMYGVDPSTTYKRITEEIDTNIPEDLVKTFRNLPGGRYFNSRGLHCFPFIVIVCDEFHLGYQYEKNDLETEYHYNFDNLDESIRSNEPDLYKQQFLESPYYSKHLNRQNVKQAYDNFRNFNNEGMCLRENAPILLLKARGNSMLYIKNPLLRSLSFFKQIDAFTMYQKLDMYISGIMGGESPKTIEVSDKTKINKHGFDKWSFRKMKQ